MASPPKETNPGTARPTYEANTSSQVITDQATQATSENVRFEDFPCSVGQERFWLLDRLDPGDSSLNVAVRWRLEGRISTPMLDRAWQSIIGRHEVLRTIFPEIEGKPIQRVLGHMPFRIAEVDLGLLPEEQRTAEGDRIGLIEARTPFDLSTGPMLRVVLLRLSPLASVLLITTHQIVSDGWSIGIMAREMGAIYDALSRGQAPQLESLAIQYGDYALWQLEWLQRRGGEAEVQYWSKQLAGVKPFAVAPDHARPEIRTTNGAIASLVLPRALTDSAQALSTERGTTLFSTALAALCAMLYRYTGEDEIVIGTQVSDRDQVELEPMIGQFVNSLILRNNLADDPTFNELINRVGDTAAQALEHRHVAIERLLSMVRAERQSANSAAISVNFIFQKTFIQNTTYDDFALIDMPSLPAGAIYDLNFFMVERPDGWRFSCQYNTDQFEAATANRLLQYFKAALESGLAAPAHRLSELRLADPQLALNLLASLNAAATAPEALSEPIWHYIDAQVQRAPGATAAVCGHRRLSYEELAMQTRLFASQLASQGIVTGARVGICFERSIEYLCALVALFRLGACCVPLDPNAPREYLRQQALATKLQAVLVHSTQHLAWAPATIATIDVDAALRASTATTQALPGAVISPDSEACITFNPDQTPATGGVRIASGALVKVLLDVGRRLRIGERDALLAHSPPTLDLSLLELLLPLLHGARVVLATSKDADSARGLLQLLRRGGVTILHATADAWSELMAAGYKGRADLKMLVSRGALPAPLARLLLQSRSEVWTLYGPQESTLAAAMTQLSAEHNDADIGQPLAGTALAVLDRNAHPTVIGATGELLLRGDSLALDCVDASADASRSPGISAPSRPPERLFRSGDLARLRADGRIQLLGRVDRKIWCRGFALDLARLEDIIRQHSDVAEVAVLAGTISNETTLVAHVAPRATSSQSPEGLPAAVLAELQRRVPQVSIPSAVIAHPSLPHTPEGAIDLRRLQQLSPGGQARDTEQLNDVEQRLTAIWCATLKLESVDPQANFFELGGHSLLAARMLAKLQAEFGRQVTLATLFRAPTIRGLAKALQQKDPRDFDFRQVVRLQPNGGRPPLIAINNTGTFYPVAKHLGPDQPFISLQLFDPSTRSEALPDTLEEVAAQYVQLIGRVQPRGPYSLIGWCAAGALAFEIACQLKLARRRVSHLFLMDAWVPNYIARQPALRRLIAGYSLRFQLVWADWRRVNSGEQSLASFLKQRTTVMRLRNLLTPGATPAVETSSQDSAALSREDYDQWLLRYLQRLTAKYEPKVYPGKITLLRSVDEPTGWLFDPNAGWAKYARDGVELRVVTGDHFTMFQEPGAIELAQFIATSTAADAKPPATGSDAAALATDASSAKTG